MLKKLELSPHALENFVREVKREKKHEIEPINYVTMTERRGKWEFYMSESYFFSFLLIFRSFKHINIIKSGIKRQPNESSRV